MKTVRIGLAGFGTVGSAVHHCLLRDAALLTQRCGVRLAVTAVAVRNPKRSRKSALPRGLLVRTEDLATSPNTDVIVELIGGCGAARELITSALRAGKPVVTANKALLAEHGSEIFGEANRRNVPIFFEASVAGGIPIVKSLREGLVANRFPRIYGIVNGTCNYILTRMTQEGMSFDEALRMAQELGYAEADPALDIDGVDAAHKATVLASLAHGGCVNFRQVHIEGIRQVSAVDVQFARQLGYEIKLLAIILSRGPNRVEVRVHPTLIPKCRRLASIHGVTNAVMVRGHVAGDIEFSGPGAGGNATASAVIADLVEAAHHLADKHACGHSSPSKSRSPTIAPRGPSVVPIGQVVSRYYLRLAVDDRPGVMAAISSVLGKSGIGISSVIQPEGHKGRSVPLVFMIHDSREDAMRKALQKIRRLSCVKARPVSFRVEVFES